MDLDKICEELDKYYKDVDEEMKETKRESLYWHYLLGKKIASSEIKDILGCHRRFR